MCSSAVMKLLEPKKNEFYDCLLLLPSFSDEFFFCLFEFVSFNQLHCVGVSVHMQWRCSGDESVVVYLDLHCG